VYLIKGLNYNLISISQLSDKGYDIIFKSNTCIVSFDEKNIFVALRRSNVYIFEMNELVDQKARCLSAIDNDASL